MAASKLVFSIWVFFFLWCFPLFGLKNHTAEASHQYYVNLQSLQSTIVNESYRTGYHFQPTKHWINDPAGPMYYNGIYHLFYQYNPYGSVWGNIIWAHSVSTDMISWTPLEPAIIPSHPFDTNGAWTGSATIIQRNKPVILYTGVDMLNRQVINMAAPKNLSDPLLKEWLKPNHNPLMVPTQINGINASSFRDPTTAWWGPDGHWRVLIGSKIGATGMAILYRSRDFVHWTKARHPLHSSKGTGMWECPDFYPVATEGSGGLDTSMSGPHVKHVLKVSLDDKKFEYYTVGKYLVSGDKKEVYVPDKASVDGATGLRYDYGKFYASKTFYDAGKVRRVLWGWLNESDTVNDDVAKGWAGIQAIPRAVWLDANGRQLMQWPILEVELLRGRKVHLQNIELKQGGLVEVKGVTASQADVEVSFDLPSLEGAETFDPSWVNPQILCAQKGNHVQGSIGPFGLLVLASSDLEEHTAVFFRIFKAHDRHVVLMCSDQSRSTLRAEVDKTTYGGLVDVDLKDRKLSLRSLVDHSIIESFGAGGKTCISARVYPTLALKNRAHLYAFNRGSKTLKISELNAWSMSKANMKNKM